MRTIRLFVLVLVSLLVVSPAFAKKPSAKERKERAEAEYARCMSIAKEEGVPAVLAYIREKQYGTSLGSSPEKLAQENCAADAMGLPRYQDLDEIEDDVGDGLVPLESKLVKIKGDVPQARHVACTQTCGYVIELAEYLEKKSHDGQKAATQEPQILVASLVRSKFDQDCLSGVKRGKECAKKTQGVYSRIKGRVKRAIKKFLYHKKSFADCSVKAICSTHLTGATVDISLLGADKKKRKLLYERLREDREKGRVLAILERAGNHFHVFVIPSQYVPHLDPA